MFTAGAKNQEWVTLLRRRQSPKGILFRELYGSSFVFRRLHSFLLPRRSKIKPPPYRLLVVAYKDPGEPTPVS